MARGIAREIRAHCKYHRQRHEGKRDRQGNPQKIPYISYHLLKNPHFSKLRKQKEF